MEKLLIDFYWTTVKSVHEVNSKRGLSKKTDAEHEKLLKELAEQFNMDYQKLKDGIDK